MEVDRALPENRDGRLVDYKHYKTDDDSYDVDELALVHNRRIRSLNCQPNSDDDRFRHIDNPADRMRNG